MDLKNTKIDMRGKSNAEKIAFQEYAFSKGCSWYCGNTETQIDLDTDFYIIDEYLDLMTTGVFEKYIKLRDITQEWAKMYVVKYVDFVAKKVKTGFIAEKKPKVYGSSKEDVREAILDFEEGEECEFNNKDSDWFTWQLIGIDPFRKDSYIPKDGTIGWPNIRKLQKPAEPVNPYEELEDKGKFKVVEVKLSDKWTKFDDMNSVSYLDETFLLSAWASHEDFAGFVIYNQDLGQFKAYSHCWHPVFGHAIGVLFKVGE